MSCVLVFFKPPLLKDAIEPKRADRAEPEPGLEVTLEGGGGGGGGDVDIDGGGAGGGGGGEVEEGSGGGGGGGGGIPPFAADV